MRELKQIQTAPAKLVRWLVPLCALAALLPWVSGAMALVAGIAVTLLWGNPYAERAKSLSRQLLQLSVIGLGAGMNLGIVGQVGVAGFGYTIVGLSATLLFGALVGRLLKVSRDVTTLISAGTAICGGSAIAAIAPAIRAKAHDISISLAVVFALNSLALLIFPAIGHALQLSERQFGLWCALAIHDTSSVVGASMAFGNRALEVATTVKLARALWIVPVTFLIGAIWAPRGTVAAEPVSEENRGNPGVGARQYPWFILGFLAMAAFFTALPSLHALSNGIAAVSRQALVVTLFLIGLGLNRAALRAAGFLPFLHGIALWLCVGTGTLGAICAGWIS